MKRRDWNRIGLAAAVIIVPGGFLLGAALTARRLRLRTAATANDPQESDPVSVKRSRATP